NRLPGNALKVLICYLSGVSYETVTNPRDTSRQRSTNVKPKRQRDHLEPFSSAMHENATDVCEQ
ncbi:hypothetical protein Bpfe_022073, partial [Biomphalaria pfeifferi]